MTNKQLAGIFAFISDLFKTFQTPQSEEGIRIWKRRLSGYDEKLIRDLIEDIYVTEQYFSFKALMDRLELATKPQLMDRADAVERVKKLMSNCNQDISSESDIVREMIKQAGGLKRLGLSTEDEHWMHKHLEVNYDRAAEILLKPDFKQLGMAAERLGIE